MFSSRAPTNLLLSKLNSVAPVERSHVILNGLDHLGPVVLNLSFGDGPSIAAGVLDRLAQNSSLGKDDQVETEPR